VRPRFNAWFLIPYWNAEFFLHSAKL